MKEEIASAILIKMKVHKQGERCELLAAYLIENKTTVRQTAHVFGVSKSTVHKDITSRLRYVNKQLYAKVKDILEQNKQERHLRGGEATRQKYLNNRGTAQLKNASLK